MHTLHQTLSEHWKVSVKVYVHIKVTALKGHYVTLYRPIFLNCLISRWAVDSFDLTSPKLKIKTCFSFKPATVLVKFNDCSHQSCFQSKQASVHSGKALINLLYTFCLAPNSRTTKLGTR